MDQFLYHYPRYMHPEAWREASLSHPHNIVLDYWLRLGLLGLAGLAWAAWLVVRRVRLATGPAAGATRPAGGLPLALGLGGAGALVALVVHGLLDNSYFVLDLAYATWIIFLVVELAGERDGAPAPAPSQRAPSPQAARPAGAYSRAELRALEA